jgi:hypothetical protein
MEENKEIEINMKDMSEFFEWFFITSTAVNKDGMTVDEFVNKVVSNGVLNSDNELDGTHRIRMFINDIEVNPLEAISECQKQFDELVNRKAQMMLKEFVEDKFKDIFNNIDNLKETIENKINNNFNNQ